MKLTVTCQSKGCKAYNKKIVYTYENYQDLGYVEIKGFTYHISCVCSLCEGLTESADEVEAPFKKGDGVSVNIVKPIKDRGKNYYDDGKIRKESDRIVFNGGTMKATKDDYKMMEKNMSKFNK